MAAILQRRRARTDGDSRSHSPSSWCCQGGACGMSSAVVEAVSTVSEHPLSADCVLHGVADSLAAQDVCRLAVVGRQLRAAVVGCLELVSVSHQAEEVLELASQFSWSCARGRRGIAVSGLPVRICGEILRQYALGLRLAARGMLAMHCERDRWVSRGTSCVFAPLGGAGTGRGRCTAGGRGREFGGGNGFIGMEFGGCRWQAWLAARRVCSGGHTNNQASAPFRTEWSVSVVCSSSKPKRRHEAEENALFLFLAANPQATIEVALLYAGASEVDVKAICPSTPLVLAIKPVRTLCVEDETERVIDFSAQPRGFQDEHRHTYESGHVLEVEGKAPVEGQIQDAGLTARWQELDKAGISAGESAVVGLGLRIVAN
eukprot:TRINITY_DN46046_c0_g1_i1.p1 TRINITY_DN46046_c0_g1~~TRINITY_DN46046_c0_g1_i1.p1  ORF type:complete len:395 (-),score=63.18 TRINITY_DN46046_c0_g1_i1:36-1157(-)